MIKTYILNDDPQSVTPELIAELATDSKVEIDEVQVVTSSEFREIIRVKGVKLVPNTQTELSFEMPEAIGDRYEYIPIKEDKRPWYVQAGSKNRRKRW